MKTPALLLLILAIPVTGYSQKAKGEVTKFNYHLDNQVVNSIPVDTALSGSQQHLPLYSSFSSWSELGNIGLPALINQYRHLRGVFEPLVFQGTDGYGTNAGDLTFYSARSPYSLLNYNSGGTADKNGQTIRAIFARDLKNKGNITVLGNYYNSPGHFSNQKANSSTINANYILNRKNYSLVAGISRISFGFSENGGLSSDEQLIGAAIPSYLTVNLSGAATKMSALTFHGVQTASICLSKIPAPLVEPTDSLAKDSVIPPPVCVKSVRFVHAFNMTSWSRNYSDAVADASFYQNNYSTTPGSKDSIRFLSWTNKINVLGDTARIGALPLVFQGGLTPDFYRYLNNDTVNSGFSLGLNGKVTSRTINSYTDMEASWVLVGFSSGDYQLALNHQRFSDSLSLVAGLSFDLYARGISPDPIIRSYRSNHFMWENDFQRQHEAGIDVKWNIPGIKASLAAGFVTNTGLIYFDTLGLPAQMNGRMMVLSAQGTKEFSAGPFHSRIFMMAQYSSSYNIRLPVFIGSTSTFMHHDINFPSTGGKLEVEYGFDLTYNTAFYGYGYMPATGAFFLENEKVLGNYPNLSGFVQMKVKRTRVFVEWCQTFADILPEQSFAVLHYPSMRPHLKFGVYWHFYD